MLEHKKIKLTFIILTASLIIDMNVRMKSILNCVKQEVLNVWHSWSLFMSWKHKLQNNIISTVAWKQRHFIKPSDVENVSRYKHMDKNMSTKISPKHLNL